MQPKFIAFMVWLWTVGSILGAAMEQSSLSSYHLATMTPVTVWESMSTQQTWGFWNIVTFVPTFFGSIFNMITFNFTFLQDPVGIYFKWLLCSPIIVMIVYGITMGFIWMFRLVLS